METLQKAMSVSACAAGLSQQVKSRWDQVRVSEFLEVYRSGQEREREHFNAEMFRIMNFGINNTIHTYGVKGSEP